MSKEIRILTGFHAGAQLTLQPGYLCIGNSSDAKIRVSDWDSPPLWILVSQDGRIARVDDDGVGNDSTQTDFGDFEPLRFGSIAIAFGDANAQWPTDLELLETMLRPSIPAAVAIDAEASIARGFGTKWWVGLAGAVLLGMSVTSAHQVGMAKPVSATATDELPRLKNALLALKQPELSIVSEGDMTKVKGLVGTSADLQIVINTLNSLAPGKIQPEITVVNDVIENVNGSLKDPNLAVKYLGRGVFLVSGTTPLAKQDQEILNKVRLDLGTNVTRLDTAIKSTDDGLPQNTEVVVQTADVLYAETADGTKHFIQGASVLPYR